MDYKVAARYILWAVNLVITGVFNLNLALESIRLRQFLTASSCSCRCRQWSHDIISVLRFLDLHRDCPIPLHNSPYRRGSILLVDSTLLVDNHRHRRGCVVDRWERDSLALSVREVIIGGENHCCLDHRIDFSTVFKG